MSFPSVVDATNSVTDSPWKSRTAPLAKGEPDGVRQHNLNFVTEKQKRILGLNPRPNLVDTARDILEDYERRGWA